MNNFKLGGILLLAFAIVLIWYAWSNCSNVVSYVVTGNGIAVANYYNDVIRHLSFYVCKGNSVLTAALNVGLPLLVVAIALIVVGIKKDR